ncbi:hypothetical protein DEU56DRAFT_762503 [Suillus clintonianus]|uniref:uncharacterized protein n=1 Tax=Suillus clintonianus TaxID=1904413 RepID=UPI001B86607A|nr:uncharacterized protein DEU56DRAFT_762503 [Suillus clintonianus]KAG2108872.1 hypothetical protein DEU56DRAFT_762503 [Suillus clintonianus]
MSSNIPIEIIIKVFALATRTRASAASWITFSRWTYGWFESLLYKSVVLEDEEEAALFLQCLRCRDMHEAFAKTSISAMYLEGHIQGITAIQILSLCKGIKNLALEIKNEDLKDLSSLQPVLDALPLTVLHMHMGITLTEDSVTTTAFFSHLTHLDVDNKDMLQHVRLECFPRLTHLALWGALVGTEPIIVSLIRRLLDHPTLEVLIFREHHKQLASFLEWNSIQDSRIVIAPQSVYMWDDLGRASMLLWEIAEQKVNRAKPNHRKFVPVGS